MNSPSLIELVATVLFAIAVLHTFATKRFLHWAHQFPAGSPTSKFLHLLGEVEIVFGFWAGVFLLFFTWSEGKDAMIHYAESRNFTEPAFVFVIMALCSARPILNVASSMMDGIARLLPFKEGHAQYLSLLIVGPLLGSFITEPAAMTVTASILLQKFFRQGLSSRFKYATLGLLFVNISIGGSLTPYAAPPILMVAGKWNWDLSFMLAHFGWKALLSVVISTFACTVLFRNELSSLRFNKQKDSADATPFWITAAHLVFLALVVLSSHHTVIFMGLFLFFLGFSTMTSSYYKEALRLKEALLVAFFLAGLVVLGGQQSWWLQPILAQLGTFTLYLGTTGLTAITDNAALTYLGSQVEGLSEAAKYSLVAGAIVGGGLTVIANAPNPAGYGILNPAFGSEGISPLRLFLGALFPTIVAFSCFWLL